MTQSLVRRKGGFAAAARGCTAWGMEDTRKGLHLGAQDLERLFRTLFETSRDGVLIARPDGTIIRANPAACRMFGKGEEEVCRLGRGAVVVDDERLRRFLAERDRAGIA